MLDQEGGLNDVQQEIIAFASSGGKNLLGMINDLLDVEKMESGSTQLAYEILSPATLIADATRQVSALVQQAEATLVVEAAQHLPGFAGDQGKLSRTLVNLIANAIRFAHRGTVTVSAAVTGNHMRFSVRDDGPGIPRDAFERIFEKFGQLDSRSRIGTGLGLAFCKLAVEAHGGQITVESVMDEGSTFSFTIPLMADVAIPSSIEGSGVRVKSPLILD